LTPVDEVSAPFGSRLLGPAGQPTTALRRRLQVLLTASLMVANVIGAVVVVVLLVWVMPGPTPTGEARAVLLPAAASYVVLGLVLGGWYGTRRAMLVLGWVLARRAPTEPERAGSMRVPRQLTAVQATLWGVAVVLFGGVALVLQPGLLPVLPVTIGFAGAVVCANAYLLSEFALRPIAARVLPEDRPVRTQTGGVGTRLLAFWGLGTAVPVTGLILLAGLALVRAGTSVTRLATAVVVLGAIVLVFGLLVTVFTTRAIVAPVRSVRDALARVRRGDLTVAVPVYDGTELGQLQAGVNHMVRGLRERDRIRDLFGRHVGQDVADVAIATLARQVELGGETRAVSVLFVDLAGSTTLAATRPPTEVVDLLNRFFAVVVDEITRQRGLVNKFMGDAALAVFGAPVPLDDHATRALAAARAIAARLPTALPRITAGIGVATGEVVAGTIGDPRRFEYTVIGDPVNQAARLTELAKQTPGRLLTTTTTVTHAAPDEARHWAPGDTVVLRGRTEPTTLHAPVRGFPAGPPG
jgi:adenylate cyclase